MDLNDPIVKEAAAHAKGIVQMQQAFGQWYAKKHGILVVNSLYEHEGQTYRIVFGSDHAPGYFLGMLVGQDGSPVGLVSSVVGIFHQPSADFGAAALSDPLNLVHALNANLTEFLGDHPEFSAVLQVFAGNSISV